MVMNNSALGSLHGNMLRMTTETTSDFWRNTREPTNSERIPAPSLHIHVRAIEVRFTNVGLLPIIETQ